MDVLAAPKSAIPSSDREFKVAAIKKWKDENASDECQKFAQKMEDAVCICVTFNGSSLRSDDITFIRSPKTALAARLIWSYFCNTEATLYSSFVAQMTFAKFGIVDAINVILADVGPDTNIIICVDELMFVANGLPSPNLSQETGLALSDFGVINYQQQRVHVVMSSVQYNPLKDLQSATQRGFHHIQLPLISKQDCSDILCHLQPSWMTYVELRGNLQAPATAIIQQAIIDCGGLPRLLEDLYYVLRREGTNIDKLTLTGIQDKLWNKSISQTIKMVWHSKLYGALTLICSGNLYEDEELDKYSDC